MGLQNEERGNFITIYNGKITQRVPEGTLGAHSRTNFTGKYVTEKYYDSFTGRLMDIQVRDGSYGKQWYLYFKDKGETYILTLPYSGSFSTAFLKMLPNIDLTQEMKVQPDVKEVDGKKRSSLFITQGGTPIKHAFTKENPNGMPDMEQVSLKGELVWDDTKRLEFLYNMVQSEIIPKLPKIEQGAPVSEEVEQAMSLEELASNDSGAEEDDDF